MSWGNIKNTIDEHYCPWDYERFASELTKFYKKDNASVTQDKDILFFKKEHYLTPSFQDKYRISFRIALNTSENSLAISIKPESQDIHNFLLHKGYNADDGYYGVKEIIPDNYNRPIYWYSERKIRKFLEDIQSQLI